MAYKVKIDGVSSFFCTMRNYDDADALASALVEYGKVIKGVYETDENGEYVRTGEEVLNAPVVIVMEEA